MRRRSLCLAAATSAALLASSAPSRAEGPAAADATEVAPPRESYPPPETRWKLSLVGLASTAGWYGAATGMSYLYPDAPGATDLRVPLIGPWQAIAHNGCAEGDPDCSRVWVVMRTIFTAMDGIGQAGGLALFAEGLLLPTQARGPERARTPAAPPPSSPPPTEKNLFWTPLPSAVGATGLGVSVVGAF